jgi:AcrR family transcriptional regulator
VAEQPIDPQPTSRGEPRSPAGSSRRNDTRQQLIRAAERLFAERGIEGVSLREINLAANQRNTSAAHYHFGSKEALIDAIFEFRRAEIGSRRDELIDAMEAAGDYSPRSVARVWVEPLVQGMEEDGGGRRYYVEFLAQLLVTSPKLAAEVLTKHHPAAGQRLQLLTSKGLPMIPCQLLLTRTSLMARHCVVSIAGFWRAGADRHVVSFEAFVSDLIDAIAGYLSAPVSEATRRLHPEVAMGGPPSSSHSNE